MINNNTQFSFYTDYDFNEAIKLENIDFYLTDKFINPLQK
jgi:hypothetical protein